MSLSAKIAHNTAIQIISKIISTILGLVAVAIITRYLGTSGFGQYTTIITFISFFAIIADLGLTLVTVRMISDPGINENKILNNLLSLRLVSALFFLGLAPLFVIFFPYSTTIKTGIFISALSFIFIALNQILIGLFQKKLKMLSASIAEVVGRVILVAGTILAVFYGFGLTGVLWATVLASLFTFLINISFSKKFVKLKLEFNWLIWQEIIKKTWPLAVTIFFNLIYLKTDTIILSLFKNEDAVGLYGVAYKIIDVLITVPFIFAGIILPFLTASWLSKDKDRFFKMLQKSFDFVMVLAIPLIIGTQFVSANIVALVAGPEFIAAGKILQVLIIAMGAIFISCTLSHAIIAIDRQKETIKMYVFTSITSVIGYLILIPNFSYFGAAWITVYSELLMCLVAIYYLKKYAGFLPSFKIAGKSLLASLAMALVLFMCYKLQTISWGLLPLLGIAGITYITFLYLLGGIKKEYLNLFKKTTDGL